MDKELKEKKVEKKREAGTPAIRELTMAEMILISGGRCVGCHE